MPMSKRMSFPLLRAEITRAIKEPPKLSNKKNSEDVGCRGEYGG